MCVVAGAQLMSALGGKRTLDRNRGDAAMKTFIPVLGIVLVLSSAAMAIGAAPPVPPDTQPGAEWIWLVCSATDQRLSSNCRFIDPIIDPRERLKAGTELGYLDAHPFPLADASPGAEVMVLVRLKVRAVKGGNAFEIAAPEDMFRALSGPEVSDPIWIRSPHESWASLFYPMRAFRMQQIGTVTMRCMVTATGGLINCWVQQETPVGLGFGKAGTRLLQYARMKPIDAKGEPVAGRPYVETFRWKPY